MANITFEELRKRRQELQDLSAALLVGPPEWEAERLLDDIQSILMQPELIGFSSN